MSSHANKRFKDSQGIERPRYFNSQGESLTLNQHLRRNKVYDVGSIVMVEYDNDGEEETGFGMIKTVNPHHEDDETTDATLVIRWLYSRDDILTDGNVDEKRLEQLNFEDGDYAVSDNEQTVFVYNVCRSVNFAAEFYYDGELHRLEDVDNLDAESDYSSCSEEEEEQEIDTRDLPNHLAVLKMWLLSYKIWTDTKYGYDWWFTLQLLWSMGRESNQARARLQNMFFDGPLREPIKIKVTWDPLPAAQSNNFCDACGMDRHSSYKWMETGWKVGQHCRQRIEALKNTCDFIQSIRTHANQNKDGLTHQWLKRTDAIMRALRERAQQAITASRS